MIFKIALGMVAMGVFFTTAVSLVDSTAPEEPAPLYTDTEGLMLGGNDPVAYFDERKTVRGKMSIVTRHHGTVVRFTSYGHRRAFLFDPDAYTPEFGGMCAWAVSEGFVAAGDPDEFDVLAGRLYLFLSAAARERFRDDPQARIAEARQKWPIVLADWMGEN